MPLVRLIYSISDVESWHSRGESIKRAISPGLCMWPSAEINRPQLDSGSLPPSHLIHCKHRLTIWVHLSSHFSPLPTVSPPLSSLTALTAPISLFYHSFFFSLSHSLNQTAVCPLPPSSLVLPSLSPSRSLSFIFSLPSPKIFLFPSMLVLID